MFYSCNRLSVQQPLLMCYSCNSLSVQQPRLICVTAVTDCQYSTTSHLGKMKLVYIMVYIKIEKVTKLMLTVLYSSVCYLATSCVPVT